jgi:hypothetical protein
MKHFVAQSHALVTDKDTGPGDELPDLILALAAKGAFLLNLPAHPGKHMPAAPNR